MRRYALRDDQWGRIKDFLPGREGHVGGAADNRLFIEAILYRYRAGIPWRDLPERFGDWKIVYQRFNRWAKSGVFERIFKLLASDHDNEYMMIDATDALGNPVEVMLTPGQAHDLTCAEPLLRICTIQGRCLATRPSTPTPSLTHSNGATSRR